MESDKSDSTDRALWLADGAADIMASIQSTFVLNSDSWASESTVLFLLIKLSFFASWFWVTAELNQPRVYNEEEKKKKMVLASDS